MNDQEISKHYQEIGNRHKERVAKKMQDFDMNKFVQESHNKFKKRTIMNKEKMYKMIGKEPPKK